MAAPRQGLPVRLERAPHRGAVFALSNASKRARTRSIGSRSRGLLFIFRSSPAVATPSLPQSPRYREARISSLSPLLNYLPLLTVVHRGPGGIPIAINHVARSYPYP